MITVAVGKVLTRAGLGKHAYVCDLISVRQRSLYFQFLLAIQVDITASEIVADFQCSTDADAI